ncbi:hypothetical protein V5O48_019432, partial [Marasmius crinis-equi]
MYRLRGEIRLNPAMMMAMDGGASLKMVDSEHRFGRARLDTRRLSHPRWLTAEQVDVYQHEVAKAQGKPTPTVPPSGGEADESSSSETLHGARSDDSIPWLEVNEIEGLEECMDT